MATASSIIRVSIIGDASGLTTTLGQAETKVGTIAKGIGAAFIALRGAQALTDFAQDSIKETDRLNDALTRLDNQLGGLSKTLEAGASSDFFLSIGLSEQDVLEMEARFADLATAIGLSDNAITSLAPDVAATAAAFSLLTDKDPATVLDLIAKAAGGSAKAAKELGVSLDSTLDPSQQLASILEQMSPSLDSVAGSTSDLEKKQAELQARVETLQAELGGPLTDALDGVLGFILDEIEALPHAVQGFQNLGKAIEDFGRTALTPLARVYDVMSNIAGLIQDVQHSIGAAIASESELISAQEWWERRNQGKP